MNKETARLIGEATKALRIKDVILYESRLFRDTPLPEGNLELHQQHKRGVQFGVSAENDDKELQVIVSLGSRIVQPDGEESPEKALVYYGIEADFAVLYTIREAVDERTIAAFAEHNAIHNVWPFWRQHVFDTLAKARLPQMEVPLFSGNGP